MKLDVPVRQRWLMIVAGAGIALLVLDRAAFTPLARLWKSNAAEIARLRSSVAEGQGLIARAVRLNELWAGIQSQAVPRDQAQSEHDVLASFENWSRSSGVELGSVKPLWRHGPTDESSLLECRLEATGSLGGLSRFLFDLESAHQALRVESAELTSRDDSGRSLTLTIIVTGLRLFPLEDAQ
jgi:hypothetical protein